MNGDGCSSSCLIEPKFTCTGGTINTKDTCKTVCGDGYRLGTEQWDDGNTSEQWDDGNLVNGDGWSSNCKNEFYYKYFTWLNLIKINKISCNVSMCNLMNALFHQYIIYFYITTCQIITISV